MLWYFVFPIFISAYALSCYKKKQAGIVIMVLLLFFSMFRAPQVGNDTKPYLENVGNASFLSSTYSVGENFELGNRDIVFYYLCYLIESNNLPPQTVLYFLSIVTIIFLYFACKRFGANFSLFLFFYVLMTAYLLSLNIARQMAAVSICFYATSLLTVASPKRFLFWLWILIAVLIHSSAFIGIVVFPLYLFHFDRRKVGLIVYLFSVLGIFIPMSGFFMRLFGYLTFFSSLNDSYGLQSDWGLAQVDILGVAYKLLTFTLFYLIYRSFSRDKKTSFIDNLFLFSLLFNGIFAAEASLATTRIRYYFLVYQALYFAFYFYNFKADKNKSTYLAVLFLSQMFLLIRISLGYAPYSMDFSLFL